MQLNDFIQSAHAIASPLSDPSLSVGERILAAISATQTVVQCNTNLGIVLLFAPLCKAAESAKSIDDLQNVLSSVLDQLTVDDARHAYAAIRQAQAGGMGRRDQHDIQHEPTITLKQAMILAQDYDLIAAQYSHNYALIFQLGLPRIISAIKCGESIEWAATLAYLYFLSEYEDTLICRKQGEKIARQVSDQARKFIRKIKNNNSLKELSVDLAAWDNELKRTGINPGTTADLVAASLLLYAFSS